MAISEYYRKKKMNGLNGQDYVYKYIPLKYLILLVENKELRIDKVSKWEDPYENFFLKSYFYTSASFYKQIVQVSTDEIRNRTYGQSWTMIEESDAMWRIYSNKDDIENIAVRIKIKIDNLFDIVYTSDKCMATTSIGPVNYKTNLDIINWLGNLKNEKNLIPKFPKYAKESLFIKRIPFAHEEEVRIIISKDTQTPAEEFLSYDIPDLNVIEDFILDPRLNKEVEEQITQELKDIGVDRHKIKKSSLYEFTPVDLRI